MSRRLILLLACLGMSASADAGVRIIGLKWQEKVTRRPRYADIESWTAPIEGKLRGKRRLVVELMNQDKKPVDGVVLQFSIEARLRRVDGKDSEGEGDRWAPAFQVGDRRIARLAPLRAKSFPINDLNVKPYLTKLRQSGFWPVELRARVMIYPTPGKKLEELSGEKILAVKWGAEKR